MNLRPTPEFVAPQLPAEAGTVIAARALAKAYLRFVSAVWRGDAAGDAFARQLDTFWVAELPVPPAEVPAAISPHGGGGHGIWWFGGSGVVLGYIAGAHGGYQVPLGAVPGLIEATADLTSDHA